MTMANSNGERISDGTTDFSGGVDSGRITTVKSQANPNGLARNQLAWLENGTVRGGGIRPRPGMKPLVQGAGWSGIFQGASMYEPIDGNPYIMLDVGGKTYQVRVDTDNSVVQVSNAATQNSATIDYHWFVQAERFRITQNGAQEPLVWDGTTLKRISGVGAVVAKLPTGTAMAYYNGRVAVASGGRQYVFGDIVGSGAGAPSSGTAPFGYTDAVLNMTEVGYATLTGSLILPTNAGNIRSFAVTSNINQPVSTGTLFIGTRKAIYAFNGGTARASWSTMEQPLQTVAQFGNGIVSDRSVVGYNGDFFFQTLEPGVRSFQMAVRYANQWGNTPISRNENRVLALSDRSMLRFSSGIEFNNRLYQTVLPFQTSVGVAHRGIMPLDFDLISSLEDKLNNSIFPAWEGMQEGLDFMQLLQGDFGGLQRAFTVVHSRVSNKIEVWELSLADRSDNGDNRISWYIETPSFDWRNPFMLKELETVELWIDRLYGSCEVEVFFRPDAWPCYVFWHAFKMCAARDCSEDPLLETPCIYPTQPYCQQDRATLMMPKPPAPCLVTNERPANLGYQFQIKIQVRGSMRIRGLLLHALPREKQPFKGLVC